jgi:serine/threonine protein phosphatase PrpC
VDNCFYTLSVGDSRIYLFRKNEKLQRYVPLQLNREHTLGAALDERAWMGAISFEDAENNMFRDSLNSAIGDKKIRHIDLAENATSFIGGDRLVLMSDGIYRFATEKEIAVEIDAPPCEASDNIVRRISEKKNPQQDNMSIMIIEKRI